MSYLNNLKLPKWGQGEDGKPNGFLTGLVVGILLFFLITAITNPEQFRRSLEGEDEIPSVERYEPKAGIPRGEELCKVDRIVDGDTIIVISDGERVRVRMIGVDTPETVKRGVKPQAYGAEATRYTTNRIDAFGNMVTLRSDGDSVDQYGRRLALVYLGRDGIELLNEELVRHGLAKVQPQYRYSDTMKDKLLRAEAAAKQEKVGIWSLPDQEKETKSKSKKEGAE